MFEFIKHEYPAIADSYNKAKQILDNASYMPTKINLKNSDDNQLDQCNIIKNVDKMAKLPTLMNNGESSNSNRCKDGTGKTRDDIDAHPKISSKKYAKKNLTEEEKREKFLSLFSSALESYNRRKTTTERPMLGSSLRTYKIQERRVCDMAPSDGDVYRVDQTSNDIIETNNHTELELVDGSQEGNPDGVLSSTNKKCAGDINEAPELLDKSRKNNLNDVTNKL
jgi:hypothetical protein